MIRTIRPNGFGITMVCFCMSLFIRGNSQAAAQDSFSETEFKTPPVETKPLCYWYWLTNVTKEGVSRDLAAMKEQGIGRAIMGFFAGPAFMSDEWLDMFRHVLTEAEKNGVEITHFNSSHHWGVGNGPWNTDEFNMRILKYSELAVDGPQAFNGKLPDVPVIHSKDNYRKDVKVIAFPAPLDNFVVPTGCTVRIGTNVLTGKDPVMNLCDGDETTMYTLPSVTASNNLVMIDFDYSEPVSIRSVVAVSFSTYLRIDGELQASGNGRTYRKVGDIRFEWEGSTEKPNRAYSAISPVTAKHYRMVLSNAAGAQMASFYPASLAGVTQHVQKQIGTESVPRPRREGEWDRSSWPYEGGPVEDPAAVTEIRDLTDRLSADGTLNWQVPDGKWVIQRFAMVPTNRGHEGVDKLNREATIRHFKNLEGKILETLRPEERKAYKYATIDSWESAQQNWTDGFVEKFQARFGYSPIEYLPVLSGRVVGNQLKSEKFLWDMRRCIADLVADEFLGTMREQCNQNGLKLWTEGDGWAGVPHETMQYLGRADEIAAEFWWVPEKKSKPKKEDFANAIDGEQRGPRVSASAAQIYGKKQVFAESFTSWNIFSDTPENMMKHHGDWAFLEGINRTVYHVYIQQSDENNMFGTTTGYGPNFNRKNTWFPMLRAYSDYTRRYNYVMSKGAPVMDVCYFIGENAPQLRGPRTPELPRGFDYLYVNGEAITRYMTVDKEGRLCLPSGVKCRLMVLPPLDTMRPEVLEKLKEFTAAGATIYGPKPVRSPSLQNYPACDVKVAKIADELWGKCDGKKVTKHTYRNGEVTYGVPLTDVLDGIRCDRDFDYKLSDQKLQAEQSELSDFSDAHYDCSNALRFKHNKNGDADIYFVVNMKEQQGFDAACSFRITNKKPEVWDLTTGKVQALKAYRFEGDRVEVPLHFVPKQSYLIVFRPASRSAGGTAKDNNPQVRELAILTGSWTVNFKSKALGAPETITFDNLIDWTQHENPKIRYYSGSAIYRKKFEFTGDTAEGGRVYLNCENIGDVAEVFVNGKSAGILWCQPWKLDVTDQLQKGDNALEINVINAWHNYICSNDELKKRFTSSCIAGKVWELKPAGVVGPVRITMEQ